MVTILLFLIILSVLVFVHEFGHFITARLSGMKVYEFALGFPPRAFGVYKDPKTGKWKWIRGKGKSNLKKTVAGHEQEEEFPDTLYTFNWLPLGGFVRIKGENGEFENEKDSFGYQKTWKKLVVLSAGVIMNFLLAGVLLGIGLIIGLPSDVTNLDDKHAIIVEAPSVIIQQITNNSPADEAGFKFGDQIVRINDQDIVGTKEMIAYVQEQGETALDVVIRREGEEAHLEVTPKTIEGEDTPRIGVSLVDAAVIRYPWYIAIPKGFVAAAKATVQIVIAFYLLIKGLILGQGLAFEVAGPVGIASIIGESARLGLNYLINTAAMISLSLAVINILPIPALDGGRILFILIEKVPGVLIEKYPVFDTKI
ncbi:MAG: PDZ domain-containing protein, partial [Candidatus Magasanikbacteria bacterium]|nr:PDZ domain-containing protein [Candidatus Magasanikbacteria bacterium]